MITLATLKDHTPLEVLQQCRDHLLAQGKRSIGLDDSYCRYINSLGHRCAGGCFVSDDEYLPNMETHSWKTLADRNMVPEYHMTLIQRMQNIHDTDEPDTWAEMFEDLEEDMKRGVL